jgi:AraC family ethanolamine operon transcriptional activator
MRDSDSSVGASWIRVESIATTSLDECDARLNASSPFVRHDQMSEGPFAAWIAQITVPKALALSLASYGPAVISTGAARDRTYAFLLPVTNPAGVYCNHYPLGPHEVAVLRPGEQFRVYRPAGFQSVVLRVDEGIVNRRCEAIFGLPLSRVLRGSTRLTASAGAVAACARHFALVCEAANRNPEQFNDRAAAHGGMDGLAGAFVEEILGVIVDPSRSRGWSARQRIVDRAWTIIENDEQTPSVGTLCSKLGVPVRTLNMAFRECLGMTPKRFITGVQLNKVRRHLARQNNETSVTETATRFGFYHFGHFATQYRDLFGERARETLARARGDTRDLQFPTERGAERSCQ